jgi:hypothetical protein
MNPLKWIGKAKDFFVKHNGIGLLLLLTIIAGSFLSKLEFSQVSNWAQGGYHMSVVNHNQIDQNQQKIDQLEAAVKRNSAHAVTVPVPVVIVVTHEKPFSSNPSLLAAARKLRHKQKSADADREQHTPVK